MDGAQILRLLFLLIVANGAPILGKRLLGAAFARPVDGGARFLDGRPLFGAAKTWRGLLLAVLAAALCAPLVGLPLSLGARLGAFAMAGDLFSSFVKRRLGLATSSRAPGLDQIPEALVPLLAIASPAALGAAEIVIVTALFFFGSQALSRLMFDLRVRERPF
ncbi:CDP-archaeol synthase [Methylosinus sp. H3A]|uniref:CDP-archaeol synthase n=1 Tax=Methylosinus sp. H3A TaxID=2785786 RepID=UPI0018C2A6C9|nr:CDP-archaeol synthase [Methylosinus sp. H3A]MBG0809433.1 CDP-archaeol synthase [Methylosinus sp. H3A]